MKKLVIDGSDVREELLTETEIAQRLLEEQSHIAEKVKEKRAKIKTIANEKILSIADTNKQRNMLAEAIELIATQPQGLSEMLSELNEPWSRIKAIRTHSNDLEAAFDNAEDKLSFDIEAGWPE